jgi:hypothetical protein
MRKSTGDLAWPPDSLMNECYACTDYGASTHDQGAANQGLFNVEGIFFCL